MTHEQDGRTDGAGQMRPRIASPDATTVRMTFNCPRRVALAMAAEAERRGMTATSLWLQAAYEVLRDAYKARVADGTIQPKS